MIYKPYCSSSQIEALKIAPSPTALEEKAG